MRIFLALAAALLSFPTAAGQSCGIPCKIDKGLRGDGDAALEVAQESRRTQTPEIISNWLRIAAENGSATGQWEYGVWLVDNAQSRQDCIRAVYWLGKAAQGGHDQAGAAIEKIQAFLNSHSQDTEACRGAL